MPGTFFRAKSAYFKHDKDDSREILTTFKDQRRFLDISNYEKQEKKISCHMHFKIEGKVVKVQLDTGAKVNVISTKVLQDLASRYPCEKS